MNECEMINLKCSLCEAYLTRPQIGAHSCDFALLGIIERLKARVAELEAENEHLKRRPAQQP